MRFLLLIIFLFFSFRLSAESVFWENKSQVREGYYSCKLNASYEVETLKNGEEKFHQKPENSVVLKIEKRDGNIGYYINVKFENEDYIVTMSSSTSYPYILSYNGFNKNMIIRLGGVYNKNRFTYVFYNKNSEEAGRGVCERI